MQVLNMSRRQLTEAQQASLLPPLDPYDNEMVMSLKEFVESPIAHELIHNGQAFQVCCSFG
jgi:hypothetical protein